MLTHWNRNVYIFLLAIPDLFRSTHLLIYTYEMLEENSSLKQVFGAEELKGELELSVCFKISDIFN